ncbi:hypothetical protein AJ79_03711 [Helicocarpus griseus UAMH5409]|uniref:Uncharacterized protein n=1 Tax=Helicocarpus griseus UAMH5409 TaxID=1447875 RepID=A0A2B7XXT8_9EURO|nr:hypothetical protein AJ79_03711 [Helicocarpus griseus UAMH5409]
MYSTKRGLIASKNSLTCASVTVTGGQEKTGGGGGLAKDDGGFKPVEPESGPSPDNPVDIIAQSSLREAVPQRRPLAHHANIKQHHGIRSSASSGPTVPFNKRPDFLVANVENRNHWKTPRTTAKVKHSNAGPDVVEGDGEYPPELPSPENEC